MIRSLTGALLLSLIGLSIGGAPTAAAAQDFRATISGQVVDSSGAAIPGATVKARRNGTNESVEAVTNSTGYYTLPYLNPGEYTIEATATGFAPLKREKIVLRVADKLNLPLTLTVGQVSEEVTVTGQQEIIQTASADRGLVFDPVKTQEYPLNGRQSYMLMALTPGVIFTQEEFGATGFSGTRGWDVNGSYRINGGRTGTNQFLLNGAPISTTGTWQLAPNVEAIQEFKVMTNTYDAQYGRTGGGTVNTTLKSGTNAWHGSVFEFFRNSVLDANTTQNNRIGAPRGKHITHQFGGVVGGPLRKDKDFVFFSLEMFREIVPFPVVTSTPPLDLRDGKNFTKYGIKIYDPLTTHLCGSKPTDPKNCFGTYIRDPFPNNEIPADRISPIGRKILSLYPAPNSPGLTQNFTASGNVGRYRYHQPMVRFDHIFNDKNRMYIVYTYQNGFEDRSGNGFPPPAQTGDIISNRQDRNFILDYTRVLSPATVLDMRLSVGRFDSTFPDGQRSFDFTADQLGMNIPHAPTVDRNTAPRINLSSYASIIGNSYSFSADNQIDFAPSITQTRGRHTLHYGFEWARVARANSGPGRANGEFTFNNSLTQQYADRGQGSLDGYSIASLLLGYADSGFIDWNDSTYRINHYLAGYIQDDWKVSPKLTLNLGLRYDVQIPFVERFNRVNAGFDFNVKNPLSDQIIARWRQLKAEYDALPPSEKGGDTRPYPDPPAEIRGGLVFPTEDNRRTYDTQWWNFQPRLGFAWNFTPKTVMRGGFGIYYRFASQGNLTTGFNQRTNYQSRSTTAPVPGVPSGGLTGPFSLQNPFPNGIIAPTGDDLGLLTNVGRGISFDGRDLKIPRSYMFSFGFERELPFGMVAEISYAGNRTVHDTLGIQWDNPPLEIYQAGQADRILLQRRLPNPFYGILPANSDFGAGTTIDAFNLYRPFPIFNGVFENTNPQGKYWYDALQTRLEKRVLSGGNAGVLTFVVSYTFSKTFEANHRLNDWNLREPPVHEIDFQDKTHSFALSGVWDLPVGSGRRFFNNPGKVVGALINGWQTNWIFTYYSGYPVGRPNAWFVCDSYKVPNPTEDQWFNNNKSCYVERPPYFLRDTDDRFSDIRNPAKPQLNFSVAKNVRWNERYGLQFRVESFNLTNTPILRGPNTDFRSPDFGKLPKAQNNFPRLVQLALKITF
jgi:hypothetical protein